MNTGLVLFAHGARDPRWALTVEALAQRCQAGAPDVPVQCAFLEFMQPDLREAVAKLVAAGVKHVVIAPVFLAAGGHVLRDLPERATALQTVFPGLSVQIEPALGASEAVIDAMARVCLQATGRLDAGPT